MKFCSCCNNFMYVDVDEEKNLLHYCKNCNHKEIHAKDAGSICVIKDNKIDDVTRYAQFLNKHIKHDPTLPRVTNIDCPNSKCSKKAEEENEVIYVKYDFVNMKYMYHCVHCGHNWRNA